MSQVNPRPRQGVPAFIVVALAATLAGCAKQRSTPQECRAAIVHMMEIQLDSPDFGNAIAQGAPEMTEHREESRQWLKSRIPSLVSSQAVAQCVERMPGSDARCTLSATTTDELMQQCHWKVVAGPRGPALGF
jgi:hypothetical protein